MKESWRLFISQEKINMIRLNKISAEYKLGDRFLEFKRSYGKQKEDFN